MAPSTASFPRIPKTPRAFVVGGKAIEFTLWFWIFYQMKENFAVKLGWRYAFQDMGHPFENGGYKGGRWGSWPARRGFVKGAGEDVY